MDWDYYDFKASDTSTAKGYLYDDNGHREKFDGVARTASEWEAYLESQDIRASVR